MKILAVTNFYPSFQNPACGTFMEEQVNSLRRSGLEVELMLVDRGREGMAAYLGLGDKVRARLARFDADLVHVLYGGVMAAQVTRSVRDRPTVVSFCGSDLLGENASGVFRKVASRIGVIASIHAARRASGVIVKAKNLLSFLPNAVKAKARVIPNGVDLQRFTPLDRELCRQRLGWPADRFHIFYPGFFGKRRRHLLCRPGRDRLRAGNGVSTSAKYRQGREHAQGRRHSLDQTRHLCGIDQL